MSTVLAVPDLHLPFDHPFALEFCKGVYSDYGCDSAVFLGDIADQHAFSSYDLSPEGYGAASELNNAQERARLWHRAFPGAKVCVGNHDQRLYRKAAASGIPKSVLRSLPELYCTPSWTYDFRHMVDGVLFTHGSDYSGVTAHRRIAENNRCSTVMGHVHTYAGLQYLACRNSLIFGMNTGCLIDLRSYAMEYAKEFDRRPVLGVGLVMSATEAHFLPMPL